MKYSEAKSRIKNLLEAKYGVEWFDHYKIEDDDISFGLARYHNLLESFGSILLVNKNNEGWLEADHLDRSEKDLADIFMELALTPLEERKEEKKYIVKVLDQDNPYFLIRWLDTNHFDIASKEDLKQEDFYASCQVIFQKDEIEEMERIFTLYIDWDKAVEEYDGEI